MSRDPKPLELRVGGRRGRREALPPGVMPRDLIWQAMRLRRRLTAREAADIGRCHLSTAATYLAALVAGGIAEEAQEGKCRVVTLVQDVGEKTPRLRRDGTTVEAREARRRAWAGIRYLGTFDVHELAAYAGTTDADAALYCRALTKAGYLMAGRRERGQPARYVFVRPRYTGPLAPQITSVICVWDPNVGRIVWPVEGEDVP